MQSDNPLHPFTTDEPANVNRVYSRRRIKENNDGIDPPTSPFFRHYLPNTATGATEPSRLTPSIAARRSVSPYHPRKWLESSPHSRSKPFHRNVLRQSAYIISVVHEKQFLAANAHKLSYGFYFIKKEWHNTPDTETVALVGVPIAHISQLFYENNDVIGMLRAHPDLQYIDGIEELSNKHIMEVLKKFQRFFENCDTDALLLLNIEPKGEGRLKRLYPCPMLTLPGGTMEDTDCNDFLQCALREFREETHLTLTSDQYELICQKKIIRDVSGHRRRSKLPVRDINDEEGSASCSSSFATAASSTYHRPSKIVSMVFAIRIKYL